LEEVVVMLIKAPEFIEAVSGRKAILESGAGE
jgi:hypothetical protein